MEDARPDSGTLIAMTTPAFPAWPLFDLRLRCRGVVLRPVSEADLPHLAEIQPADWEHDPHAELLPGLDLRQNRARLCYQDYWRSVGTWSPSSWSLEFAVESDGMVVGVQALEAEQFPVLRTVGSGSWLIQRVRGRGIGVAMRIAVLGLAFDHLGALAAVTSARTDNSASLGVSRRVGYSDNGVSLTDSARGVVELRQFRLTAPVWQAAGHGAEVTVTGFEPCRPWFGLGAPERDQEADRQAAS
jgi:RimJ/RimL family protein N-acetyltransferase